MKKPFLNSFPNSLHVVLLPLFITATTAVAQSTPSAPSTYPEKAARILAQHLTEAWGKPIIVENAVGAAGIVAAD